jgi:hypothetical protein
VRLEEVGDPPALDVEGAEGRFVGFDRITLDDDRAMSRARDRQRGRQSGDTASGDGEPHALVVSHSFPLS